VTFRSAATSAPKLAGKELEADAVGAQLLGKRGEFDASAEPLVLEPRC
jgi:predicted Zn-dependent protease